MHCPQGARGTEKFPGGRPPRSLFATMGPQRGPLQSGGPGVAGDVAPRGWGRKPRAPGGYPPVVGARADVGRRRCRGSCHGRERDGCQVLQLDGAKGVASERKSAVKIVVINGSPKGNVTITMQYVAYIQKHFPQHEFVICNVSEGIRQLEQNDGKFRETMAAVRKADGVLWASPVYLFLFPSQLKRFIELIHERQSQADLLGKYTAVLTTSVHFFDHTAHNYLNAVCDDLGMKYTGMFSADMEDMLHEAGRKQLHLFAHQFLKGIEKKTPVTRTFQPLRMEGVSYLPAEPRPRKIDHPAKVDARLS